VVRYFGPDNGSAYVQLPNGRFAAGRIAQVFADEDGQVPADILGGTRDVQGAPLEEVIVDSTGRMNFWFPDDQPVVWVSVNGGPLVRVTADLQDQLADVDGGAGGGVTTAELNAAIATHSSDTSAVHGIADTSVLETTSGAQTKASAAQSAAIAAAATDATNKVAAHAAATDPHGDRAYTDGQLATKADLVGGKVPSSQIPAIALTQFLGNVGSQAAMLALTGELGDWAIRTDTPGTWIIVGSDPTQLSNWVSIVTPGGGGGTITSVNGNAGPTVVLGKADIGLGNVDNTTDAGKPVSTAQQTALDLKAPLASPTFTGTVAGVTKAMVGLGNVDNTADASKTFAESQITNLITDLAAKQPLDADLTTIAGLTATTDNMIQGVASAWASRTPAQVKTALALNNVTNTSDANKPVSTAQQNALDLKANLASPTFTGTVAGITKSMVGLGSVDNTSDAGKPVSTAQQTALDAKADLVGGLVPTSQLPALAITEVFTVVSQAAMLALTAQRGDVAVRTDVAKTFILSTDSPSTLADWKEIPAIGAVVSVNGQQGVVVLAKADVGLGSVSNALQLVAANNLSDLANAGTARTNLGVPPSTRTVSAGTGLTGGGDLSADRSLAVAYGTSTGTAAQGNDSRITGAIPASTGTAKGDLLAFTASATVARLAVGANGDRLRANSAATPGVEWANDRQTQSWAFSGTAVVTTGKARWYNRTGRTLTVVGCWAAANTAPTGAALVCDVNKNGTTIFTTQGNRPSVAISGNGGTMATPDVTSVADGDYLTVDVDVIGSTVAGADVTVGVVYW
jgi:hypothetical protein